MSIATKTGLSTALLNRFMVAASREMCQIHLRSYWGWRPRFERTTALSSYRRRLISGHIGTRFNSTSHGLESRQTTLSSNRSTAASGKNCSTRVGLNRSRKRVKWQPPGVPNTTTIGLTDRSEIAPPRSLHGRLRRPHHKPRISSRFRPEIRYTVNKPRISSRFRPEIRYTASRTDIQNRTSEESLRSSLLEQGFFTFSTLWSPHDA